MTKPCPCGKGADYLECCGRFIELQQIPETPEELMRSRYTAYTMANVDYIAQTMKSPASDNYDKIAAKKWAKEATWKKLDVTGSSTTVNSGWVEFIAYFIINKTPQTIHELSEFRRDGGIWYYIDGKHLP